MSEPLKASCHYCDWTGTADEVVIHEIPLGHDSKIPNRFELCLKCGKSIPAQSKGLSSADWEARLKR